MAGHGCSGGDGEPMLIVARPRVVDINNVIVVIVVIGLDDVTGKNPLKTSA